jgi:hypothetical protein
LQHGTGWANVVTDGGADRPVNQTDADNKEVE